MRRVHPIISTKSFLGDDAAVLARDEQRGTGIATPPSTRVDGVEGTRHKILISTQVMTPEGYNRVALVSEAEGGRAATTAYAWQPPGTPRCSNSSQRPEEHIGLRVHLASIGHPPLGGKPPTAGGRDTALPAAAARLRAPRHQATRVVRAVAPFGRDGRPSAEVTKRAVLRT